MNNVYQINDNIIFNPKTREIKHIDSGKIYAIGTNEVELLTYLMKNPSVVISRQEIIENVWIKRGIVVEDGSLAQSISLCRRAMEDSKSVIISTARGKGYKFCANIEPYIPRAALIEEESRRKANILKKNNFDLNFIIMSFVLFVSSTIVGGIVANIGKYNSEIGIEINSYSKCQLKIHEQSPIELTSVNIYRYSRNYLALSSSGESFSYYEGFEGISCYE